MGRSFYLTNFSIKRKPVKTVQLIFLLVATVIITVLLNSFALEVCEDVPLNFLSLNISNKNPKGQNNIYFIESTQPCNKMLNMRLRQVCSIESAARLNPDQDVFLYAVDVIGSSPTSENLKLLNILNSLKNVHLKVINAKSFTIGTPLESLLQKGLNSYSSYLKYHRSDVLRYTLLWKYSGTYLDLDVMSQKPLNLLGHNFAVQEDPKSAAAATINFNLNAVGRQISNLVINDLAVNFNGRKWAESSVGVLTRALKQLCGVKKLSEVSKQEHCEGFKLYPPDTFYAINYRDRYLLLDERYLDEAMIRVSDSVGVHTWDSLTRDITLKKYGKSAMVMLAKKFCPLTYEAIADYF